MLSFEHRVVGALLGPGDPGRRAAVTRHVDLALRAMPEVIRLGIAGESVLLGAVVGVRRTVRRTTPAEELAWLEDHRVGLVRQWVRALRSLVLFAEQEMLEAGASAAGGWAAPGGAAERVGEASGAGVR